MPLGFSPLLLLLLFPLGNFCGGLHLRRGCARNPKYPSGELVRAWFFFVFVFFKYRLTTFPGSRRGSPHPSSLRCHPNSSLPCCCCSPPAPPGAFRCLCLRSPAPTRASQGARGAAPAPCFVSADWRWRGELLGNQGNTRCTRTRRVTSPKYAPVLLDVTGHQ